MSSQEPTEPIKYSTKQIVTYALVSMMVLIPTMFTFVVVFSIAIVHIFNYLGLNVATNSPIQFIIGGLAGMCIFLIHRSIDKRVFQWIQYNSLK